MRKGVKLIGSSAFASRADGIALVETDTLIKTHSNHTVELDNIEPVPHYEDVKGPQIITSDTARQGPLRSPVLAVLIGSLVAVFLAFALVYFFSY